MERNIFGAQQNTHKGTYRDVAAIITAMTDGERPFLCQTVEAVIADPNIGQIVLCVEENNTWVETALKTFIENPRLLIVRMGMAFLGAVRNRALEYVKMPWVAYCDGDDTWCRDKIRAQRSWASATASDFVGADHCLINEKGNVCAFALARNIPMPSSWLVRTEIMKRYPFRDSLSTVEDGEWWIRTNGLVQKARCPKILLKYRIRSGSLSSNTPSKRRKAKIVALASLPIVREVVLVLTWCLWLMTRRENYIWLEEWGQQRSPKDDRASRAENSIELALKAKSSSR
jgi:glycosyltransferase involved in cell wall biosynthesis